MTANRCPNCRRLYGTGLDRCGATGTLASEQWHIALCACRGAEIAILRAKLERVKALADLGWVISCGQVLEILEADDGNV